ncbi:MAG: hypothetical protein K0A95_02015 [Chromatiales bacterium]|nr:hypothetical protein [Chromatiales bacterium]
MKLVYTCSIASQSRGGRATGWLNQPFSTTAMRQHMKSLISHSEVHHMMHKQEAGWMWGYGLGHGLLWLLVFAALVIGLVALFKYLSINK